MGSSPDSGPSREVAALSGENVLVLLADDLGIDALAVYGVGNDLPPTPHLDALAAGGVVFDNAWSQPTCSPTRAALQTGLPGFRSGIGTIVPTYSPGPDLSPDLLTLPRMLDLGTERRYAHALFGKWHLSSLDSVPELGPTRAGWEHFAGSVEGQIPSYFQWNKVVDGVLVPTDRYATTETVDDALAWILEQEKPWLCFVSFQAPHAPFHAPPPELHTQTLPPGPPRTSCGSAVGEDPRPFFKAMVEALDTEIGRLLAGIPQDVRRRTTVVFLGDNGTDYCLGVPPFDGPAKSTLYQGGIHVPCIVASPRVRRPGRSSALVQTSDLLATVADLVGIDLAERFPNRTLDSVSWVPYLEDPARPSLRETVFAEFFTPNGATDFAPTPCLPFACQPDLGFQSPGGPRLDSCGPPLYGLYGAHLVPLQLTGTPGGARSILRIGPLQPGVDPTVGLQVASRFPTAEIEFQTAPNGVLSTSLFTGGLPADPVWQFLVEDPQNPGVFRASNALHLEFLETRMWAIRDTRYKLIHFSPCHEELYDLWTDPFEAHDLLALPLQSDGAGALRRLRTAARQRIALGPAPR